MKQGRALEEVLKEIDRITQQKEDYVVDTRAMRFEDNQLIIPDVRDKGFGLTDISHRQISESVGIPTKYYNRMRENSPELLETNINHWFQETPMRRMVRTLGDTSRAFLSDRYRRLDNEDLVAAMLPVLGKYPGIHIKSCELSNTRLYIKAVTDSLQGELAKGDVVYGGIVISNSEVGWGALRIEPLIYRLVCENGLIVPDYGIRKFHIGRAHQSEEYFSRLSDEAIAADDKAFWLKARDLLNSTLTEDVFGKIVGRMVAAKEDEIKADPISAVEKLSKKKGFSLEEQKSVLTNLLANEELNRLGLSNAITRTSQQIESYDRATEFEYMGADIISMSKTEWKEIAGIN